MNKTNFKRIVLCLICVLLVAAMSVCMVGCEAKDTKAPQTTGAAGNAGITKLGEGATVFNFTVTDADGNTKEYEISTDKTTVGDALLELDLIAGDDGDYGLYVKTVDGITADYDTDGSYWAFYVNGEYASSGVDTTDITAGAAYGFKVEK